MRDEGLRRIARLTTWVAAVGVAGTGFLAAALSHATPGRATTTASSSSPAVSPASSPLQSGPGGATGTPAGDPGFQAPIQAPVPVQQVPIVRSGAS